MKNYTYDQVVEDHYHGGYIKYDVVRLEGAWVVTQIAFEDDSDRVYVTKMTASAFKCNAENFAQRMWDEKAQMTEFDKYKRYIQEEIRNR